MECVDWYLGFLALVAASPRSRAQVASVLAFIISHTTFLVAQNDETGRCPEDRRIEVRCLMSPSLIPSLQPLLPAFKLQGSGVAVSPQVYIRQ